MEKAISAWIALTIVVFAGGSSSVASYASVAKPARWPVLLVLDLLGLVLVRDRLRTLRLVPAEFAAAGLVLLGLLSVAWSLAPRLSAERAVSVGQIAVAAGALALAARYRPDRARMFVIGIAAGAAVVALLGFVVLAIDPSLGGQPAGAFNPWRYKGFGENPNTVSMFLAVAAPLAVWLALSSQRAAWRAMWGGVIVLFVLTISLSGSRGALVAGLVGVLMLVLAAPAPQWRARLVSAAAVGAVFVGAVLVSQIPQPVVGASASVTTIELGTTTSGGTGTTSTAPRPGPLPRGLPSVSGSHLEDELQVPGQEQPRQLLSSSGRVQAWWWALGDARKRPIAGYGFGTESNVFVDRLYSFQGGLPENSFVGITLQLGAAGLFALSAFVLLIAWSALVALRALPVSSTERGLAAACAGTAFAGLALSVGQSYLYSAGNIATLTVWICAFLAADSARTWSVRA